MKNQPCTIGRTANCRKFKPCKVCITKKSKCDACRNLITIIDGNVDIAHGTRSWSNIAFQYKGKPVMAKDQGKGQASKLEEEKDHQVTLMIQPEPVSSILIRI